MKVKVEFTKKEFSKSYLEKRFKVDICTYMIMLYVCMCLTHNMICSESKYKYKKLKFAFKV